MSQLKILSYISAPAGTDRLTFRRSYLRKTLMPLLDNLEEITRCTANMLSEDVSGGLPGDRMESEDASLEPPHDGLLEFWIDARAERLGAIVDAIVNCDGKVDAYWVEELIEKEDTSDVQPPFVRLMAPCTPLPHLIAPEVFQFWSDHVAKALRIHVGMNKYCRNWHLSAITTDSPIYFGTPLVSFSSREDWEERFYSSSAGAKEIAEDVSRFVDKLFPHIMVEHRIK